MTNAINLAALGFGGMDTSTLVSSLVSIESEPETQLTAEQTNIQAAGTTISGFGSDLGALADAAIQLSDPDTFSAMTASSSDSSITPNVSGDPAAGQWTVSVSAIAQAQRSLSSGAASNSQGVGLSGNLSISVGGTTQAIPVTSGDSLTDIANAIDSSGLPLQASVAFDGSQYHLLVSGDNTGAANAVSFDESGLSSSSGYTLGLSSPSSVLQKAQDAQLTVGGLAVTSSSNAVADAIPGVTFNITQPTTSATVSIEPDNTSIEQQVQSFVTAYNAVVAAGHAAAGYGTTAASNTLLQGDSSVRDSLDGLSSLVAEQVPGTTGTYTTLASVGVTLNDDGTMSLDTTALGNALSTDPTGVQQLFASNASTGSQGIMSAITSEVSSLTGAQGMVTSELSAFQTRSTSIGSQITELQLQISEYQTTLQTEFTNMNAMLAQYKQTAAALNDESGSSSSSSSTNSVL